MNPSSAQSHDLLSLEDLAFADIVAIVTRAQAFAAAWPTGNLPRSMAGKKVALIVNDGGWRNTSAFDLGVGSMGGQCVHVPLRLGEREEIADIAAYLGNWFDAIVARAPELELLRALAAAADIPVINARTRQNHPCETLGDLAFFWHRRGRLDGIKVAVVAPEANILGSWIELARSAPLEVVQVYPERWHARALPGERFRVSTDMGELDDADILVTDCWPPGASAAELLPYQITGRVLDRLADGTEFIPCPPVHRGEEVTAEAMRHRSCHVTEAKGFLLHAQNAVLEWSLGRLDQA